MLHSLLSHAEKHVVLLSMIPRTMNGSPGLASGH